MGENGNKRGEEERLKNTSAEELRTRLQENERERSVLERQLSLSQTGRRQDVLEKAAQRIHEKEEVLKNRVTGVERSGDVAKQQVIKHTEAMHESVDRRKESLLRELDRYQVEKERLLEIQMEELAKFKREIANFEKQSWSHMETQLYFENLERVLHRPIVSADQLLELEEKSLIFALETMGRLSPTSNGLILAPGTPFLEGRKSIIFEQKVAVELPLEIKRQITFWAGCSAGILSATTTHWLDVAKVLRQLGLQRPTTFRGYFVGLPMGAIAQGQRFGVTLLLNSVLQQHIKEHFPQFQPGTIRHGVASFSLSVFAAGLGEALANPPVVVKNWQISQTMTAWHSVTTLWARGKVPIFFRGVVPGVVRKGLANAIVLQSIEPMKTYLESAVHEVWGVDTTKTSSKVLTNHPDRVKTLMQTKNVTLWQAISEATRDPFRGAFWAGLRKGAIRGVNWGALGVFTSLMEEAYKSRNLSSAYEARAGVC
eukprot:GEMP01012382.1.p1 GENE.GEMP01012382.1~~GEMP01012382.1.p1  ORF type:complete len:485 (+),score=71.26 GEMP01012382.1:77-1531(+)